ncbi:hypothetical protein [Burkholderia orbicola]|uniref:hypothetical protein n=1 Tax=Burkholderia orbicola TaxID=2978683 RepID=UPI002FE22A38
MNKRWVIYVTLCAMVMQHPAYPQALLAPIETLAINRAEAAIITRVAISRGFAANDPRIASTLTAMGRSSTALNVVSTGAATALAFAGAPVWLTIVAGLGILAAGTAIMAGKMTLSLSNDGKQVTATQPPPTSVNTSYPGPASPPIQGSRFGWLDSVLALGAGVYSNGPQYHADFQRFPVLPTGNNKNFTYMIFGDDGDSVTIVASTLEQASQIEALRTQAQGQLSCPSSSCYGFDYASLFYAYAQGAMYPDIWRTSSVKPYVNKNGQWVPGPSVVSTSKSAWWANPAVFPLTSPDLGSLYQRINPGTLSEPLDAATLASITNNTWQQAAAQPGYDGLPYSPVQPVTASDVQPWIDANRNTAPTVGDLFSPAAAPGQTVVISPTVQPGQVQNPGTNTGTGNAGTGTGTGPNVNVVNTPNVNVTNKVSVDLGTDPTVGSPTLESIPTIAMILQPLLNLLPDLKAWVVPAHSSHCPEPSIDLLSKTFKMTAHCDLAEQNRTTITSLSLAGFAIAALFIVLAA